jgi:transposase-like protein
MRWFWIQLFQLQTNRQRENWSSVVKGCGIWVSTRGRGTYQEDKPPVFILADRGTGETYVHPAKAAGESTIRLLLSNRTQESMTVYTDGFRAYEPLNEDDAFDREYVVHGEGEYADEEVHVNTCESQRRWRDGGSRPIGEFPKTSSHPTSERYSFENVSVENPATKLSKQSSKLRYDPTNNRLPKSVGRKLSTCHIS